MSNPHQYALIPSTAVFSAWWQNCLSSSAGLAWRVACPLALFVSCSSAWAQSEKSPDARVVEITAADSKVAPSSPAGASWQAATAYPVGISGYGFAQVGEDMYVISGFADPGGNVQVQSVRRYNATTNIWTKRADIPVASFSPAAASFGGKIYVADGDAGANLIRIYDIATDTWTAGPARPVVTSSYGAAAGAFNGKVYVVGGSTATTTTVSIYNIATNMWSTDPTPAPSPFYLGGYTQVGQFLYLIGSRTVKPGENSTVSMRLDMATNTWTTGPAWTPARVDFALAAAGTRLFAIGGENSNGTASAQVDELETSVWPGGTWVASPDNLPSPRRGNSAGFVSTGRTGGEIWSTGGVNANVLLNEHLFRAAPTCTDYTYTIGAGSIVPGTFDTGNSGDDVSTVVALPFSYKLYDRDFATVSVGSNGHLTFGTVNDTFDPTCLPVANATYAIAPYWTDQCTGACTGVSGGGLGIFTSTSGVAPNRIFNIEWRTAYYNSGGAGVPLNYEVRLYEGQAKFDVIYGTVNSFTPPQSRKLTSGVQKNGSEFTLQGCDPTGGTSPPVASGNLYSYTLRSTNCAPAPARTGFLYALNNHSAGNNIYGFSVNETTGTLTALSGFPMATGGTGGFPPSEALRADSVNQRLYAINNGSGTISAFAINPASGALTPMPFSPIGLGAGDWTTLAVHPTGSPLLVGQFSASGIKSFQITASTVSEAAGSPFSTGAVPAFSSILSRDGNYYYEGGGNNSFFGGFNVNPGNGVLTALSGSPYNSGFVPAAYVTDSTGRLLIADNSDAKLRGFTTAGGIPSPFSGNPFVSGMFTPLAGLLHPNERFYLVVDGNGQFGSHRVIGSGTGTTLTPVPGSPFPSAVSSPYHLESNQTGAFLFGIHTAPRNISTYRVEPNTGALSNPSAQLANTLGNTGSAVSLAYTNASMVRTVVSRKTHGSAGVFDVDLPLTGTRGIECRSGSGAGSNDHQIILKFKAPVTLSSAELLSGTIGNGVVSSNGELLTIDLTGVNNAQTIVLRLNRVTDGVNTGDVTIPIGFLLGDVGSSGSVGTSDISQVKAQGGTATATNFRSDVTVNGTVNASDISLVKARSGTGPIP